jgi:hypothetical protein
LPVLFVGGHTKRCHIRQLQRTAATPAPAFHTCAHAQHQAVRSQEASIRCTHRGPQSQTARMPAGTRRRPSWLPIWAAAVGWLAAAAGGRVLTAGDNRGLWVCV